MALIFVLVTIGAAVLGGLLGFGLYVAIEWFVNRW